LSTVGPTGKLTGMRLAGAEDVFRAAVFSWLDRQRGLYGDRIPWKVLQSFEYDGQRAALITQRGIRWMAGRPALTFQTTYSHDTSRAPYADHVGADGLPRYKYQGSDPSRPDNVSMKQAERLGLPLVWFVGTGEGVYSAQYPVWLLGHDDTTLDFTVAVDAEQRALVDDVGVDPDVKRRYVERLTRQRLHQPIFRSMVLRAYEQRCAICRLGHLSLLDAAHIRSDAIGGEPVITNGLAMCKIHHAAYDQNVLSVDPRYRVVIAPEVRLEKDGPMLLHGIQEMHDQPISLPTRTKERPDRTLLAERHAVCLENVGA
jgi:putative restriction endonuclease